MSHHIPGRRAVRIAYRLWPMLLLFCFSELATPTVALSKRPKPVPCPDGAYRVQGEPLVSGATTPRTDSVLLKTVTRPTIDIGCGTADTARVVAKRGFDQIKAKWKQCGDLARVRLSAKIGKPDCSRLAGVVKAKAARPRQFSAQRFSCGDGTLDAGAGETCDASAPAGDAACPGRCTDRCVCGDQGTTSTTVASTTSTTSPTSCVPAAEVCDGVDNDCDGVTDEGSDLCTLANAAATCVAGACHVDSCNPSFTNCNALAADGCEVNTGTNAGACGGCGVACTDDQICASGQCAVPCNGVPGEDCVTVEGEGLDEHTNDSPAEAIPIAIGGPIEGTIGNPTDGGDADLDFYKFDAVAGDLLRVTISNRAGGTFPAFGLIVIDDAKHSVVRKIRPGDTDTSIATREFVVEQSGTYRVLITDERNIGPEPDVVGGASFRYGAKISRVSRLATPLTLPVVQQPGSVPDTGDVALFSFDAVEGQELMASTRAVQLPTPSKVDTILLLFDSSTVPPTLVAKNDDQDLINMILDSLVDVPAPTSGSYLLVVDHYDVTGVLPADRQYDLTVSAPCFHCEALFHGSLGTGAACEGSGGLFEKLVDCICAGPCDAECATECSQGGQVSEVCDACIAAPNGCGSDQAPCLADTGPTTTTTPTTSTTTTTMAICGDGLLQSGETCDDTNAVNGDGCSATCLVEPGFACTGQPSSCTPLCSDGIKDGNETDVDCGGICANKCGLTKACNLNVDCVSASCQSGTCKCPPTSHTFTVGSSTADLFSIAQWPGGTQTFEAATGCSVQIANPTGGIDLFSAGSSFAVAQVEGFSTCFGTGGEDGDGCQPFSCPPLGIGSCSSARPRCSVGNNGSATAKYGVQCLP